jgi:FkbM family methyltransferase
MPAWIKAGTRIAIYAGGGHTRDLFQHPDFARLNVVGILDRNRSLHGQLIQGCEVFPVEALDRLRAQVILVSSPPHHEAIMAEMSSKWTSYGIEVVDLCQGAKSHSALFPLAFSLGMELDDSLPGRLKVSSPGNPRRSVVLDSKVWAYAADVIRNFEYYFGAAEPDVKTDSEWILDVSKPSYKTLKPSGVRMHFPSLPEPEVTTNVYLTHGEIVPGNVVLDLGAYAGGSVLWFSRTVGPKGRVLALEPDRLNLDSLQKNVVEHDLSNVMIEPAAIWESDGESSFQAEGCMGSSLSEVLERNHSMITVPTYTLATLMTRHGLDRIDFIKMDIEGAETSVLRQAMPLLKELGPRMVIEPHYVHGCLNATEVQALLCQGGFDSRLIHQGDDSNHPLIFAWPVD